MKSSPPVRIFRTRFVLLVLLPAGLLSIPACHRSEIRTYVAPKEIDFVAPDPAAPAPVMAPEMPAVAYTAPPDWEVLPGGRTNAAQFRCNTPQGEITVGITALASMEGRESLLVGMWRGVFQLPELSDEETKKALSPVEVAGMTGQIFEVQGDREGQTLRIITAFVHHGGKSWFFKIQGPPEAVETQKSAFIDFLKTVKLPSA